MYNRFSFNDNRNRLGREQFTSFRASGIVNCSRLNEGIFAQKYKYCKYYTGIVLYYKYILIANEVCE